MRIRAQVTLSVLLALCMACDNIEGGSAAPSSLEPGTNDPQGNEPDTAYVPPADVQLTPPAGRISDVPTVGLNMSRQVVDMDVIGAGHRKLRCTLAGSQGQRSLAVALKDDSLVEFASADFHMPPTAASDAKGNLMICWNTLTGRATPYSPNGPDPATGMALHCRLYDAQGQLGQVTRIEAPTVGCWIQKVVALPGGGFRLLYKGDDGWFIGDHTNPMHGVYDAFYDGKVWSKPNLIVPVPDPSVEYEMPDPEMLPSDDPMPGAAEGG